MTWSDFLIKYLFFLSISVINELEGLSRGGKVIQPLLSSPLTPKLDIFTSSNPVRTGSHNDPNHAVKVAEASKKALLFLKSKNPAVK